VPIEFNCPHCQHRLRTPDDKAGLSAKCPACGESIWVPLPHETAKPHQAGDARADRGGEERQGTPQHTGGEDAGAAAPPPVLGRRRKPGREITPEDLAIGPLMSDSWTLYTEQLAPLVLGPLLFQLATQAVLVPLFCCGAVTGPFIILLWPVAWLVGALAAIGSNWLYFKVARGEPATIGDAFAGFGIASGFLGAMFLWILLETLLVFLGLLLLIVPGLFLSMILWVQPRVMIDERLSATQTISRGWELATANLGTVLLIALIGFGIVAVSGLVVVGPIFTAPYVGLFMTVAYLRMTGQSICLDSRHAE
jgi:hypothetical protein